MGKVPGTIMSLGLLALLSTGCVANLESIYREFYLKDAPSLSIDAKQRIIFSVKRGEDVVVCAEPSPDAISAVSAALSGSASYQQIAAQFAASISESTAYVGLRTQTIQLLRDAFYRLCEAHISGAIGKGQYARQQDRFRRGMVTLLAIEQLTGAVRAPSVIVTSSGQAGTGKDLVQAQQNLEKTTILEKEKLAVLQQAKDLVQKDQATVKTYTAARDQAKAAKPPVQADIDKTQTDLDKANATLTADTAKQKTAQTEADAATEQRTLVQKAVDQAKRMVEASTAAGPGAIEAVQSPSKLSDASVQIVATTIQQLVDQVYTHDERTQFCLDYLLDHPEGATPSNQLSRLCAVHLQLVTSDAFELLKQRDPSGAESLKSRGYFK